VSSDLRGLISEASALGVGMGLLIGKPLGIFIFSFFAVQSGICKLPADLNWKFILGVGFLGGIGFTMSIFITLLAFNQAELIQNTKLVILLYSCLAGLFGWTILYFALKKRFAKSISK
jgi:NhaA family Na+:H+ antiporter